MKSIIFMCSVILLSFLACLCFCNQAEQDSYFMNTWGREIQPKLYCYDTKENCDDKKEDGLMTSYPEDLSFKCVKMLDDTSRHGHCKDKTHFEEKVCTDEKCKEGCENDEELGGCEVSERRKGYFCRVEDCSSVYFDVAMYGSIGLLVLGFVFAICIVGFLCCLVAGALFLSCIIWQSLI